MKKKKNLYNILKNHTLDEYKAKYDISKAIVLSKDAVDKFNKNNKTKSRGDIFNGRNWWLIDNTYYEVGKYLEIKPFVHKGHGAGFKIALASVLGGIGIAGTLGGGGYAIYKAVKAYNPTPGPVPSEEAIVISSDGTITVKDRSKIVGDYTIPETIDGITVKSIATNGFRNCTQLTSITLPKTLESIGESGFRNCSNLTVVNAAASQLTEIGEDAFFDCPALETFYAPDSLETIGDYAFHECTSLKNFNLSGNSKLNKIGYAAFTRCTALTDFFFPDNLETIDQCAFEGSSIQSVKIGSTSKLQTINNCAFEDCKNLKLVNIENENVKQFGSEAFCGCESLEECTLPSSLTSISVSCFSGCHSLTKINIPDAVTEINSYAFNGCYSISDILLPKGLKTIGVASFADCFSLSQIVIPSSVTTFEYRSFENCLSLRTVYVDSVAAIKDISTSSGYDSSCLFQFANTVYIGENIPTETVLCNDLNNNFSISSSAEVSGYTRKGTAKSEMYFWAYDWGNIEDKRYYRCSDETQSEVTITPNGNSGFVFGLLSGAFINNKTITKVIIPSCTTQLGNSDKSMVFYGCDNLKTVEFASNSELTSICGECFKNCGVENITIPEKVTYFGTGAFENCTSLKNINIPASVNSIYSNCFKGCDSLTTVTIDSSSISKLPTNDTYIFNAKTILLKESLKADLEEGDYLYDNYTIPEEATSGYYTCTKK